MTRPTFATFLALSMALPPLSLASADTTSTKHKVKRQPGRVVQQQKIACTKYGCFPIARRCTPYAQMDFWGNPTGYDGIACR